MKISFIGSRGVPAKYGGFETFVDEVSTGLKAKGYEVIVVGDAEQKEKMESIDEYNGVRLLYSKYIKAKNLNLFYFESMMIAMKHSDLIYCCGTGAGYFAFLPRWFGKIFITNPDGIEWQRDKWSWPIKLFLKSLFYSAAKNSKYIVYDSKGIEKLFKEKYNRVKNGMVIEYGAYLNKYIDIDSQSVCETLNGYNLTPGKYHLVVSRLEPENNVEMIVRGFSLTRKKYPLIIVGNQLNTPYVKKLKMYESESIRFIGGIYDKDALEIVRANAFSYLHGHSVGGTNPSLLEAMASKNYCVCHDNMFNREVVLDNGSYFSAEQDVSDILDFLEDLDNSAKYHAGREGAFNRVKDYYSWEKIIDRYDNYFRSIVKNEAGVTCCNSD